MAYRVIHQKGTPGNRARGLAAGVFSGCFPLFGLQTILGIALATLIKGNLLLAVAATWVSNPVTYLPLYWLNYKVGSLVLGNGSNIKEFDQFGFNEFWDQGLFVVTRLLFGSTLVGAFLSCLAGIFVYLFLKIFYLKNDSN